MVTEAVGLQSAASRQAATGECNGILVMSTLGVDCGLTRWRDYVSWLAEETTWGAAGKAHGTMYWWINSAILPPLDLSEFKA